MKRILFTLLLLPYFSCFAQEKTISCGTKDVLPASVEQQMRMLPQQMEERRARTTVENLSICRISVEIDSDTYLEYEKDTSAIYRKVLENIELSSRIFESEVNTRLIVTNIRIWKDPKTDPFYASNRLYDLIYRLSITPASNDNYDKRVYLYTKQSADYSGVGNLPGVFSVSPLTNISTILHEFGHNFGSPHTHSCAWPGGPIDYCADIEGNCYSNSLESIRNGTIMSYCRTGSGVVETFHPLCQALMRNYTTSFAQITKLPETVQLDKRESFSVGDFWYWPVSNLATSYDIGYSNTADFSNEIILKSPFNGVKIPELVPGSDYYFRIRAINSFGNSGWSEGKKIKVTSKSLATPQIKPYANGQNLIAPNSAITLPFSNVSGATYYEVQVTTSLDLKYQNARTQTISNNELTFKPPYPSPFRWRVRAGNTDRKGSWSEEGFFTVNVSNYNGIAFPSFDDGTVPTFFPFYYTPKGYFSQVQITIADNVAFSNPIFKKEYENAYEFFSDFVKDLPPNKQLFLSVKEWNKDFGYFPSSLLADAVLPISTNSIVLPKNLTFLSEIDQKIFESWVNNLVITKNHVWWQKPYGGLVKLDQEDFSFKLYDLKNTNGMVAFTESSRIEGSSDGKVHLLNSGTSQLRRYLTIDSDNVPNSNDLATFTFPSFIVGFNPDANLFWSGTEIYRLSGSKLNLMTTSPNGKYFIDAKVFQNNIWVLVGRTVDFGNEILLINAQDGSIIKSLSFENTADLKKSISQLEIDNVGTIWIRQNDSNSSSLSAFDGSSWRHFSNSNSPFQYGARSIFVSPSGITYALNQDGHFSTVFKYVDSRWTVVGQPIPLPYFSGDIFVDKNENVWITGAYGISRLANCPPSPVAKASNQIIDFGDQVELRADNCPNGSVWSWKNEGGDTKDFKVSFNTPLKLAPASTTQFTVRCAGSNCADNDTTFSVKVRPVISLTATDKAEYCPAENLIISMNIKGSFEADNKFTVKLTHQNGVNSSYSGLTQTGGKVQIKLPDDLNQGKYLVNVLTSNPAIISKDSIEISINPLATATISADKLQIVPSEKDSSNITITFTGTKPWDFTRWDGRAITSNSETYKTGFSLLQPQSYELIIKDLKDANCDNGKVLNTVTIVASPITSVSNPAEMIRLYPNPTADKIIIDCGSRPGCDYSFELVNSRGILVQKYTIHPGFNVWDISTLPSGIFIISTTENKQKLTWKIVKQ